MLYVSFALTTAILIVLVSSVQVYPFVRYIWKSSLAVSALVGQILVGLVFLAAISEYKQPSLAFSFLVNCPPYIGGSFAALVYVGVLHVKLLDSKYQIGSGPLAVNPLEVLTLSFISEGLVQKGVMDKMNVEAKSFALQHVNQNQIAVRLAVKCALDGQVNDGRLLELAAQAFRAVELTAEDVRNFTLLTVLWKAAASTKRAEEFLYEGEKRLE